MPTWLRILLIVAVIFALIFAATAFVGYRWWMNNKDRLLEAAKHAEGDGEVFGRGKEATACVDEALTRAHSCRGLPCELTVRLFVDGCMKTATTTRDYCAAVPAQTEFLKRAQWSLDECTRRGQANDPRCGRIMQGIATACDREASK